MPADRFFFVYHKWNGIICQQKWWGEVTIEGKPMPVLAKHEITEAEFRLPLLDLEAKYPYKEKA